MNTYTGGCHCGKIKYEVDMDEPASVISCNCSLCSKRGWLLTFVPFSQFRFLSHESDLTEYQFNKKLIHHLFCKTCGTASFGRGVGQDGSEMVAINVRCLTNLDIAKIPVVEYDGKSV